MKTKFISSVFATQKYVFQSFFDLFHNSRYACIRATKPVLILLGAVLLLTGCYPKKGSALYSLGKEGVLRFLNDEAWELHQICVDGDCEVIINDENNVFGIETNNPSPNYCTDEPGEFYILGKYIRETDPETYEEKKAILSSPDYFAISEFDTVKNEIKIKLCTPSGYFSGQLKIISEYTISVITRRPEFDDKLVIHVFKKR